MWLARQRSSLHGLLGKRTLQIRTTNRFNQNDTEYSDQIDEEMEDSNAENEVPEVEQTGAAPTFSNYWYENYYAPEEVDSDGGYASDSRFLDRFHGFEDIPMTKPNNRQLDSDSVEESDQEEFEREETPQIEKKEGESSEESDHYEDVKSLANEHGLVDPVEGLQHLNQKLERTRKKGSLTDSFLTKYKVNDYKPFLDPKYSKENLTSRPSTYLDLMRIMPKPKVNLKVNLNVKDTAQFNLTLLELFGVENYDQARDYFFAVTRQSDSVADVNSYNIAMAEFIDHGDIGHAGIFYGLLLQSKCKPNIVTYNALLSACVKYSSSEQAKYYLNEMKNQGIEPNETTKEYLIALHLRSGEIEQAQQIISELQNVPGHINGLFARAYASRGDFNKMNEYAWRKDYTLSENHCSAICMDLAKNHSFTVLKEFLENILNNNAKISWAVSEELVQIANDPRISDFSLTPGLNNVLTECTVAPTDTERLNMIRDATIKEREEEVVFRKGRKHVPIWERRVEYKNPADVAWDTLIQEHLDIALKERNLRKTYASLSRADADNERDHDPAPPPRKREFKKNQNFK